MIRCFLFFGMILLNVLFCREIYGQRRAVLEKMNVIEVKKVNFQGSCNENCLVDSLNVKTIESIEKYKFIACICDPLPEFIGIGGDPIDRSYIKKNYSIHTTNFNVFNREEIKRMACFYYK